jgi:hypothetical protein
MPQRLWAIVYRILQLMVIALLVYGLAQTLPFDLAVLFAGDLLSYVEVAAAVWVAAQTMRLRGAAAYLRLRVPHLVGRARRRAGHFARRLTRTLPTADDDRPAALAFA